MTSNRTYYRSLEGSPGAFYLTPRHLQLDGTTLYVSEFFKWYEDDCVEEEGAIKNFIRAYADDRVIEKVNAAARIRYIDYDWALNCPENFPAF